MPGSVRMPTSILEHAVFPLATNTHDAIECRTYEVARRCLVSCNSLQLYLVVRWSEEQDTNKLSINIINMNNLLMQAFLFPADRTVSLNLGAGPRSFHASPVSNDTPDNPLYKRIDWARVEGVKYAIVNPVDTTDILYLTPGEFTRMVRAYASQEGAIVVLATPRSRKPRNQGGDDTSASLSLSKTPILTVAEGGWVTAFNWLGRSVLNSFRGESKDPGNSSTSTILLHDRNIMANFQIWSESSLIG